VIKKEVKVKKPRSCVDDLLTKKIIGACHEVHNELGPGFVEKIYLKALKIVHSITKKSASSELIW
jgi:hypothetical protein